MGNNLKENKEFILRYFNALSGVVKTPDMCDKYMKDDELKEHILFFDTIFPKYEIFADEMTAEGDRVVVRARMTGTHEGIFNGIPPTFKKVEMPFVVTYTIDNGLIVDHWLVADQMMLMQQMGIVEENPTT